MTILLNAVQRGVYIKHCQNEFYNDNIELFQSIVSEARKNKVIILTTKSLAPVLDRVVTEDYTLIICENPTLTISVGQTIKGNTKNLYDKCSI